MSDDLYRKVWWAFEHWDRYRLICNVATTIWALHMLGYGATTHIKGQAWWETASYACINAAAAWGMLWFILRFAWIYAAIAALGYFPTPKQPFLGIWAVLLTAIPGALLVTGYIVAAAWFIGYRTPVHP